MVDLEIKDCYKFDDLLRIMEILRAPDGCMWDREQDHHSIRRNFIEETYEVCEAIDDEDTEHMKEELGDVLLQGVYDLAWLLHKRHSSLNTAMYYALV